MKPARVTVTDNLGPRKLVSLHLGAAEAQALDMLEAKNFPIRHDCILHWYSGPSDQLHRAIGAGCYFSVGPRMLATKRGREYARIIPESRLLLETDMPASAGKPYSAEEWQADLLAALNQLAEIRHIPIQHLREAIACTSKALLAR